MDKKSSGLSLGRREFLMASSALAGAGVLPFGGLGNAFAAPSRLARSTRGMVTSPHSLASEAGLEVLKRGGTAVEALIAVGSTLCVTYPHFTGLGGDAFWVLSNKDGNVHTISGIGQAAMQYPNYQGSIPVRGPGSMLTTAATVDTWDRAYRYSKERWGGKQGWEGLFKRAVEYAEKGFPVTPSQKFWQDFRAKDFAGWPGFAATFMPKGRMLEAGEQLRQPQLARTLESLARDGARGFYEGRLGQRIAAGLKEAGSPLTQADLARTAAREGPPLRVGYRDGELLGLAPPTQGITTLEIMGILDRFKLSSVAEGSADYYHLLVEAVKRAFIERDRYVADPEFVDVPVNRMLSAANLDRMANEIDLKKAMPWPQPFRHGDTVYLGAVDQYGNCASMLQTIYFDWGSGVMAGDTGILWHNRGASFKLDPQHHNVLKPGKRPFHTLNPGMYLKQGKPHLLYGTQGADGQPQTLSCVLTRLIDYQLDPLTALSKPRFLLGRTFSDSKDSLKLEADAGEAVFAELAARGHEMAQIPAQSQLAGHPGAIRIDAGGISGAHDPRSDGIALGL